jgi:ribokinase
VIVPDVPRVVVVGSLNLDYIASVEKLPAPGETVVASGLIRRFGGKGANQAVAAARQGAKVSLIGCVGDDDDGRAYCKQLKTEGIDVAGITRTGKALTGTALIAVAGNAENIIIVAAGANGKLTAASIRGVPSLIAKAGAVLLQFEIPMTTTKAVVLLANRLGVPVVLNPSPMREGFPWGKCRLDTLIVNAGEAQAIFGLPAEGFAQCRRAWTNALAQCLVGHLIITRGAQPTVCLSATEYLQVPTLKVQPVDTVGAGDAFAGTFVACRAKGLDLLSAIRLANCAGALTTLKPGAQEAIPTRAATQRALRVLP